MVLCWAVYEQSTDFLIGLFVTEEMAVEARAIVQKCYPDMGFTVRTEVLRDSLDDWEFAFGSDE